MRFLILFTLINLPFFLKADPSSSSLIKSIKINGIKCDWTSSKINLKALDDVLFIEFHDSIKDTLVCILKKYDKIVDKDTVLHHTTRFMNLTGGDYVLDYFLLNNANDSLLKHNELKINKEEKVLEARWVLPAIIFCTILLIGAFFYFWNINSYRQKIKLLGIRNKIASDLHDEVGSNLSSISVMLNSVQKKVVNEQPELKPLLEDIRQTSSETILNLRDTVWMINPDNDSLEKLFEKMRSFALKVLIPQDIVLNFKNNLDPKKTLNISMDQRYNIYMMYREAVNNILKHAEATIVDITIEPDKEGFIILIADNGKGFDTSAQYEGNGLLNFKKRAKECFIDLTLVSTPQSSMHNIDNASGTTLKMIIPEL